MTTKPIIPTIEAETIKIDMGQNCGAFYLILNRAENGTISRIEAHAGKLKAGACGVLQLKVITELINSKIKYGSKIDNIARKYLIDNICREDMSHLENGYHSCIDAIGRVILERL